MAWFGVLLFSVITFDSQQAKVGYCVSNIFKTLSVMYEIQKLQVSTHILT